MNTGSGRSLVSQSLSFPNGTVNGGGSALTLDFGFATDERPQPGIILDSFTISITGPNGTGYLVTLDASGTTWAPLVPGALPVPASSLQWQTEPFVVPTQGLTNLASYALIYTVPNNWQGAPLTINFDLFDNQNSVPSLGYYLVPVPEPSCAALMGLGLALWKREQARRRLRLG